MALMSAYLVTTKNLEAFLNAVQGAKAPERFTTKFLKDLEFTSSNDRLFQSLLKGLGFLDESGAPTDRYFAYLDPSQSKRVLAIAVRDAYADLFALNRNAHKMGAEEVKGKFRTLTQGQKSENVINWMGNTFKALTDLADWSEPAVPDKGDEPKPDGQPLPPSPEESGHPRQRPRDFSLQYNIQLILPESRDQAVYDALFSSLRRHLL